MQKFYNLTNDHLFKGVFSEANNLKLLLKDFFNINCQNIVYKNTELLEINRSHKHAIVDMLLDCDNGIYILELQNLNRHNFLERLIFYMGAVIHNHSLLKNEDYENLRPIKVLALINYEDDYDSYVKAYLKHKQSILTKMIEFKILNLKKLEKNKRFKNKPLFKMFKCKSLEEIEVFKSDKVYKEIYEKMKQYNSDEKERKKMEEAEEILQYEPENYNAAYIKGEEAGEKLGLIKGKLEGKKEGMKEGKQERNVEIAKKMLITNLDYKYISEITDIPIKIIKSLSKSLNIEKKSIIKSA